MPDEAREQAAGAAPSYADLTALVADLRAEVAELRDAVVARDERIAELERSLAEARRSTKRQAAPFSQGEPAEDPKRPGRRSGERHGRHGHRMAPPAADRELADPLPHACPSCGGGVDHVRDAEQWQVELPDPRPVTTRFVIGVGRCRDCGARVQGRHPEQASGAVAAASQLGPQAKSFAAWLHYGLGLSFAKCATVLGRLGIGVTAGALCSGAQRTGTALVPVHAEICRRINVAPAVVMDETGWREGGRAVGVAVGVAVGGHHRLRHRLLGGRGPGLRGGHHPRRRRLRRRGRARRVGPLPLLYRRHPPELPGPFAPAMPSPRR